MSRFQSVLGPGWSVKPMSLAQATRSVAAHDDFSHAALAPNELNGRFRGPVALACRMRSSTRAFWRWRPCWPASWPSTTPGAVSVRNLVTRCLSESVNASCAPGMGAFLA